MERKLGKFETAAAISGEYAIFNIVGVVLLEGAPSPEILNQALTVLQNRHPFLRVRLVKKMGKHYFESGGISAIPLSVVDREDDDHWVAVAEDGLNYKFDHLDGPLVQCTYLKGEVNRCEIILTAQHSIVDGTSVENLLDEMISICSKIVSGTKIEDFEPYPPMPPVEMVFPAGFRGFDLNRKTLGYLLKQMGDEFGYQLGLIGKRKPPINTKTWGRIIQFTTSGDTPARLVRKSRKVKVTLNSALNAALLLSVRKHLYNEAAGLYRYMSMADLRPYLDPVPPDYQVGCYISPLRYTIRVHVGDDLWSLARRINNQIYQSSKKGEKFLASVMAEGFLRMTFVLEKFRMSTTALSYGGSSSRSVHTYEPYRIRAIRGFVSNFGLGPEFSGRVGLYGDELWWDMLYLETDMNQTMGLLITEEISRMLQHAVIE
jgi:hypothetical protein